MGTPTEELIKEYKEIIAKLTAERGHLVGALKGLVKAVDEHKANGYPCSIPTLRAEVALKAAGEEV